MGTRTVDWVGEPVMKPKTPTQTVGLRCAQHQPTAAPASPHP